MSLNIPKEVKLCTTCKIKKNGDVLDYTDEESSEYKEVFLKIRGAGSIISAKTSETIAKWDVVSGKLSLLFSDDEMRQVGKLEETVLTTTSDHKSLRLEVVPSQPTCCSGGGSSWDVVETNRNHRLIEFSRNAQSYQLEFLRGSNEEKWYAFVLVAHRWKQCA